MEGAIHCEVKAIVGGPAGARTFTLQKLIQKTPPESWGTGGAGFALTSTASTI